jgi:hypothetical protein
MRDAPVMNPGTGANEFSAKIQAPTTAKRLLNFRRKFVAVGGIAHG